MRFRRFLISLLQWVWACALFAGLSVGVTAFFNWVLGEHRPLWTGAVTGLILLPGTWLLSHAERRGWIKGFLWSRTEVRKRQKELADDRERILAEARAKPRH